MSSQPNTGGFSLFPNPNTSAGPSRNQTPRPRASTPQNGNREPSSATEMTPPRNFRQQQQPTIDRKQSVREGKQPETNPYRRASFERRQQEASSSASAAAAAAGAAAFVQRPSPVADVPPRCETAFSDANTLVRSNSTRSRSSIAKPPLTADAGLPSSGAAGAGGEPTGLRSIFPVYNPELPADRQEYYPTQASPTHIPRAVISRPLYSPTNIPEQVQQPQPTHQQQSQHQHQQYPSQHHQHQQHQHRHHADGGIIMNDAALSPHARSARAAGHTQSVGSAAGVAAPHPAMARWPPNRPVHEPPVTPHISSTEELRSLWKVVNGWKATASEGRVYCLKMTAEKDTPIYTLSSSSQPFYNLRIDPTSASAYVTLSRHDPSKLYKTPTAATQVVLDLNSPDGPSAPPSIPASVVGTGKEGKHWQEALTTTLEPESRRHAPEDGLVALLYPSAAARVAVERPDDVATVMTAERECARLVWDDDTGNHYVVHPALAMPFCVTVERNPAWSRTEYTLEHLESPQHVARLTRDGTGNGWLEVDTGIAGKIDSVYIVEVAVAALMLVAHGDRQFQHVEVFEAPPMVFAAPPGSIRDGVVGGGGGGFGLGGGGSRRASSRLSGVSRKEKKKADKKAERRARSGRGRIEEFELDIESQTSDLKKLDVTKDKDKIPGVARAMIKLLSVTFKCFIWVLTACFKALTGCIALLGRCLTSEKL